MYNTNRLVSENEFRPIVSDKQIFNLADAGITHQFIHDRKNYSYLNASIGDKLAAWRAG